MLKFKDNAEPFEQPIKTTRERFVDLFRKNPVSPVPDTPQRSFFGKVEDLFLGQVQGKDYRPLSERGITSPLSAEEATGRYPSVKELKQIPGWATTPVYEKLQALPEDVKKTTTKWQEKLVNHFGGDNVPDAMHVMFMESSGDPKAINTNSNGSRDYGLFQINDIHANEIKDKFGYNMKDLLDPDKNLEVASWIWRRQGWTPWVGAKTLALK